MGNTGRTIEFLGYKCEVHKAEYGNKRTALQLVDEDGMPMCMASVNLPDVPLADGFIFIKDYSENTGVLAALIKGGIVEDTGGTARSGFVEVPVCKLLI